MRIAADPSAAAAKNYIYFMTLRKNVPRKKDLHLFYIRYFDTVEIPSAMIANRMNQQI